MGSLHATSRSYTKRQCVQVQIYCFMTYRVLFHVTLLLPVAIFFLNVILSDWNFRFTFLESFEDFLHRNSENSLWTKCNSVDAYIFQGYHPFLAAICAFFPWATQERKIWWVHFCLQSCHIFFIFPEFSRFFLQKFKFSWVFPEIWTIFQIPWVFQVYHVFQVCGHPVL